MEREHRSHHPHDSRAPCRYSFEGYNGPGFHIAGLIHPSLRTALLPRELLNKRGHTLRVAIGRPVSTDTLDRLGTDHDAMNYLHQRTVLLRSRTKKPASFVWAPPPESPGCRSRRSPSPPAAKPKPCLQNQSCSNPEIIASPSRLPSKFPTPSAKSAASARSRSATPVKAPAVRSISIVSIPTTRTSGSHIAIPGRSPEHTGSSGRTPSTPRIGSTPAPSSRFPPRPARKPAPRPRTRPLLRSTQAPEELPGSAALVERDSAATLRATLVHKTLFGPVSISRDYSAASRSLMVSYLESSCTRPELVEPSGTAASIPWRQAPRSRRRTSRPASAQPGRTLRSRRRHGS